ncbi:MAG: glycosyltransferase family 4 protein [Aquaticitalea sp.]
MENFKRPLHIAIYSGEVPSETFIERLIDGLAKNGCIIYLFGVQKKRVAYSSNILLSTYTHNRLTKFLHLIKYNVLLTLFRKNDKKKLDGILKSNSKNRLYSKVKYYPVLWHKPDIFHLQWAKGVEEWAWVQEFGMKLVVSFLGTHINYSPITIPKYDIMYKRYFPQVDGFHAVSNAIALKGEKYNASKEKIKVVYSGLDLDMFKFHSKKTNNQVFKIISVGREHWVKGYTYAIDACKYLKDHNFQFEYVIIGGADTIELTYQLHDLNLQQHVKLLGRLPFEEVKEYMHNADLLLLPSVEEGIANVVLEAMASKTLVLSTNCGGMDEVIDDNENGFLVPIRDSQQMAKRILEIADVSKIKRSEIIEKAYEKVRKQHNETLMIKNMLELYTRL